VKWTTSGDGVFDHANQVTPTYTPGSADISTGQVTLCLTADALYPCNDATDCVTLNLIPLSEVEIGVEHDQICFGASYTFTSATASDYSSINWFTTNGNGVFENPNVLQATYIPDYLDYQAGCIIIGVEVEPVSPCQFAATDEMELCIFAYPFVDAGEDGYICIDEPYQLNGQAQNFNYVMWSSLGDGTFNDPFVLNAIYTAGQADILLGEVELSLTVIPVSPCTQTSVDYISLTVRDCQHVTLTQGWSGLSSYLVPASAELDNIFDPVMDQLVILQTMTEAWWPAQNINTIGTWDVYDGYKIKVTETVDLNIPGTEVGNHVLPLAQGWNLIPVLSGCSVDVEELFAQTSVGMVKEVAGWRLFWPSLGINSLEYLQPGKSYFVLMNTAGAVMFPECGAFKTQLLPGTPEMTSEFDIPSEWAVSNPTPATHTIALPAIAGVSCGFSVGDVIGVFNEWGICYGFTGWNGKNTTIVAYGDDPTTEVKDGFVEGELMKFACYSAKARIIKEMTAEFDASFPHYDGTFNTNGISAIKAGVVGIEDNLVDEMLIYPNPVNNQLNVVYKNYENLTISIVNLQGQTLYVCRPEGEMTRIDMAGMAKGIYFVQLTDGKTVRFEKIVKQ